MRELSLFTGAGGGLLGTKLLGWEHVGYVEYNDYCQRVIRQRIDDGILDNAPIFGDIKTFISEGYADSYQGLVDVITAGFPCQPFSVAGKQKGENDERNMWPETIEVIRRVRPSYAYLENVPGLLANKYVRRIFGDLAESGFDARWCVLGADDLGAPHIRKRTWVVVSYADKFRRCGVQQKSRLFQETNKKSSDAPCSYWIFRGKNRFGNVWKTEPDVGRVADGVASRVDRLKAIGNGQVPVVAATAWKILTGE